MATVSNVLNNKPNVSPAFAARVRAAVEEFGYVADGYASRLRSGKQALAGVVVPDLTNPMFAAFVSTLEQVARLDGYDLLVLSSANSATEEAARLSNIRAWRPAGVIVIPCDGSLSARHPANADWPVVVADRIPDDRQFDLVAVENQQAAADVTAHLAEQGCRTLVVLGSSLRISNVRERWKGISLTKGKMSIAMLEVGLDRALIGPKVRALLIGQPRPDALFALDHVTTLEAYRVIAELGLSIPREIAFASFDETEWMRLVTPAVTAIAQPVEAMARSAWAQLMARMAGNTAPPLTTRLPCAITFRGSTLRPRTVPESTDINGRKANQED